LIKPIKTEKERWITSIETSLKTLANIRASTAIQKKYRRSQYDY